MKVLSKEEVVAVSGAGYTDAPGWGATIGGLAGSFFGPYGSIIGTGAGHIIENTDYNKMGEDYKEHISQQIENGEIPAD